MKNGNQTLKAIAWSEVVWYWECPNCGSYNETSNTGIGNTCCDMCNTDVEVKKGR